MKLNLGCGNDKKQGYINIDVSKEVKPNKIWDLEKTPLPFKENSIDEILAFHILEHINNFIPLMHDLHRICKNRAILKVKTPFYSSLGQFNDPTHVRFFTPFSFDYFRKGNYSHQVGAKKDMFKVKKVKLNIWLGKNKYLNRFFNFLVNLNHPHYCRLFAWTFPSSEIEFEIEVLK